ncbi:MAG TPA: response regulator [Rhodospirillaceae bacterium]|nr:response regulator [Rhodospirillaceae bacterium]
MTVDLRRLKVLLIDDEPFICTTIRQILHLIGVAQANVYEAGSAKDGMRETLRIRPDLIFCDIHMPEEDGFAFVSQLRKATIGAIANTPLVMLTSDSREEAVLVARHLKVEGYLVKPVSINTIKLSMERALKEPLS